MLQNECVAYNFIILKNVKISFDQNFSRIHNLDVVYRAAYKALLQFSFICLIHRTIGKIHTRFQYAFMWTFTFFLFALR